ncbi:heterogeneous nuclear ribonucleoprotein, putative [Pediculus humanus corporis]|uniref:Heterogeneous nuclear ribonucleoprotein, putative n=1 Tax=Pediculus humanus subsp. corporis TaxID=121224 RepID=E0VZ13_PEDHC|nr:heterogeneous nuclear ribonucleoprotein, putative [Pediculus humanus corporis]EEB18619.1 heterogeneous nuclear ribonucleoprotein, putative [Pediculus humanus corporis]
MNLGFDNFGGGNCVGVLRRLDDEKENESKKKLDFKMESINLIIYSVTDPGDPDSVIFITKGKKKKISMETAGMPMPGYHFIAPNHIVKTPIH